MLSRTMNSKIPDREYKNRLAICCAKIRSKNNFKSKAGVFLQRDVAVAWCQRASDYPATHEGRPEQYALIPHDAIADRMTLASLVKQFRVAES